MARVARLDFRAFFKSGMHALVHENSAFSRILNDESSTSDSDAFQKLMESTKVKVNETNQLIKNLAI